MTESSNALLILKIYHHSNIMKNHELTNRAFIYLRLYNSVAKRIEQQVADRWLTGSKPGRDFTSPINWNPFQLEFTEA